MRLRFRLNTSSFSRFVERATAALDVGQAGPVRDGMLAASDAHGESLRERYTGASAGDGTWAPLAESTVKARERRGETPLDILRISGSIESSLARDDENHVLETTDKSIIEGTRHRLARYHQDGTERMPARPIIVAPTEEALDAMRTELANGLREAVEGAAQ